VTTDQPVKVRHGCTGKQAFTRFDDARYRAKRIRSRSGAPVAAYHCRHCHQYHVGGNEDHGPQRAAKDKRRELRTKLEREADR